MPEHIYIDTSILRSYFEKKTDEGRIARSSVAKIRAKMGNNSISVKIPQIVLGELMTSICKGECDDDFKQLILEKLGVNPVYDLPVANTEVLSCAQQLLCGDDFLDPNDALIASQALRDANATWLLTTDEKLIGNRVILGKMAEFDHKIHIAESYR